MKVKYLGESDPLMLMHKVYDVIAVEGDPEIGDWYRIVDETDEDYLYPAERALSLIQSPTSQTILGYKTPRGEVVRYDTQNGDIVKDFPKTGIKTMFKPDDAEDYFLRHKRIDKGVDTE